MICGVWVRLYDTETMISIMLIQDLNECYQILETVSSSVILTGMDVCPTHCVDEDNIGMNVMRA